MQNLLNELKTLLATQPRFTQEGRMIKQAVIDAAQSLDPELLQLLIGHDAIKRHFFQEVGNILVFDKVKLLRFVSNKAFLEDSYTAFKNKIGLVTKNSDGTYDAYLSDTKEVVLAYPYKDCMLEGGQTKEEKKRNEIFWNETLAPDDIDRLKEPKAFSNIKRYDADGVHENITDLSLNDNYIIKGNNLLALYSLLPIYRGKVKLIYIDPPYNTGNDGFQYNDAFNHSTWLTFMKDRLKVARELLSEEGIIMIQMTDIEQHYLRVLMDELFKRENFVEQIIWKKRGGAPNDKIIGAIHEYIMLYAKSKTTVVLNRKVRSNKILARYSNPDNHPKGVWAVDNLMANVKGGRHVASLYFSIVNPFTNEEHYPSSDGNWRFNKQKIQKLIENNEIYFGIDGKGRPKLKRFLCDVKDGVPYDTLWVDLPMGTSGTSEIQQIFGSVNEFDTAKPERLIQEVLNLTTNGNDLVLDFFLGSGTTAAVAQKMGRRYIGVEQMDYAETITAARLQKVIAGEQGGISKSVNWQGGGSFIYMELAKANQHFVDAIQAADTEAELLAIWERMQAEAFISYRIDLDRKSDYFGKDYEALSFENKKRFLKECLDKNMLYVPYCDMESAEFGMSENDKVTTRAFYGLKNQAQ